MDNVEYKSVMEALHEGKRELEAIDHLRRGPKTRAILHCIFAIETIAGVLLRTGEGS